MDIKIGKSVIPKMDMRSEKQKHQDFLDTPDLEDDCRKDIGESLQKSKDFENRFKEQWAFEGDQGYFFSVVFKSSEERDLFLKGHRVTLTHDDHVIYDEIKHIFKEVSK
jgi:hypothetical protein